MNMTEELSAIPVNGATMDIDGKPCIHYDGYWIRRYDPPPETAENKRNLINQLTKRVFHHTELGINTPGQRLELARVAYERETDLERKRVNAAMLAGALLNRGRDIFGVVFEMQQKGIQICPENELLLEVENCFLEALDLGRQVRHYSGEEGLDELWGEPFKAFSMPIADFYHTRYVKIAQTMAAIDRITSAMNSTYVCPADDAELRAMITDYGDAAKELCEVWKTDPAFFEVWPRFVADGAYIRKRLEAARDASADLAGLMRVQKGANIIKYIAFARVPMPVTTRRFLDSCEAAAKASG